MRKKKLWILVDQEAVKELNDAVNDQWAFIVGLQDLARWNGSPARLNPLISEEMKNDLLQLRENTEKISAALNTAILWETI